MAAAFRRTVLLAVALGSLSACAQGPAELLGSGAFAGPEADRAVRAPGERDALERSLDAAARRQDAEGRAAAGDTGAAVALQVIRQQQEEEARALLSAATTGDGAPPCEPGAPGCDEVAPPAAE